MKPITCIAAFRWRKALSALVAFWVCLVLHGACLPAQAQTLTTLHVFDPTTGDGANSEAALLQGSDGSIYGTTYNGGPTYVNVGEQGDGTIFKIDPLGNYTLLHTFNGHPSDGASPAAALIQGSDGFFYGTTYGGGTGGYGTVFQMDSAGNITILHSFASTEANGIGGLMQASDGLLYGTAPGGGAHNQGSVFKLDTAGHFALLRSFAGMDGANPQAPLIQGRDGFLYGTAPHGGANFDGTVFRIDTAGNFTVLHAFNGTDGRLPFAALIQGSDGFFYGMTQQGGQDGYGTVFQMDSAGNITTLHSFSGTVTDGSYPMAALIQASEGNFYGTTYSGGTHGNGIIFKIDTAGNFSLLYSFPPQGVPDGADPRAGLIQGSSGRLYGTTFAGGSTSLTDPQGTVFQLDLGLPAYVSVAGQLTLQGCVSSAISSQSLTFTFRPTNGNNPFSYNAALTANGSFTLSSIPLGSYTLAIKGSKWLQKVVPVTTTAGNVSGLSATLLAGDVNGDNQVSLADYVLLRNAFGSRPGMSNWKANADLNCDGQVSLADYVLLRNNFGQQGDP